MRLMIVALAIALSGCGYSELYRQYAAACSLEKNQKSITVPMESGKLLTINQGCSIQPPVDADAKWVNLGGIITQTVVGEVMATIRSTESSKQQANVLIEGYRAAGDQVGGDGFIGGGNEGFTEKTAPPAEPVFVPPFVPPPAP